MKLNPLNIYNLSEEFATSIKIFNTQTDYNKLKIILNFFLSNTIEQQQNIKNTYKNFPYAINTLPSANILNPYSFGLLLSIINTFYKQYSKNNILKEINNINKSSIQLKNIKACFVNLIGVKLKYINNTNTCMQVYSTQSNNYSTQYQTLLTQLSKQSETASSLYQSSVLFVKEIIDPTTNTIPANINTIATDEISKIQPNLDKLLNNKSSIGKMVTDLQNNTNINNTPNYLLKNSQEQLQTIINQVNNLKTNVNTANTLTQESQQLLIDTQNLISNIKIKINNRIDTLQQSINLNVQQINANYVTGQGIQNNIKILIDRITQMKNDANSLNNSLPAKNNYITDDNQQTTNTNNYNLLISVSNTSSLLDNFNNLLLSLLNYKTYGENNNIDSSSIIKQLNTVENMFNQTQIYLEQGNANIISMQNISNQIDSIYKNTANKFVYFCKVFVEKYNTDIDTVITNATKNNNDIQKIYQSILSVNNTIQSNTTSVANSYKTAATDITNQAKIHSDRANDSLNYITTNGNILKNNANEINSMNIETDNDINNIILTITTKTQNALSLKADIYQKLSYMSYDTITNLSQTIDYYLIAINNNISKECLGMTPGLFGIYFIKNLCVK